jgi:HEAT repeat protein
VVRNWDALGSETQQNVADHVHHLADALRTVAAEPSGQGRRNVVALVDQTRSVAMAYLLAEQLHADQDTELQRLAAVALLRLTRSHLRRPAGDATDPAAYARGIEHLITTLLRGCACFHQHRRRDVVLATFLLAHRLDRRLLNAVAKAEGAGAAARDLLARPEHAAAAGALLSLSSFEPLRESVVKGLGSTELQQRQAEVVGRSHLLLCPEVRQTVRRVRQSQRLIPDEAVVGSPAYGVVAARWVEHIAVTRREKIAVLRDLAGSSSRAARLSAMGVLMRLEQPEADDVIASMCFDAEPAIARTALRHLVRQKWPNLVELSVRLITSGPEPVREAAQSIIAPRGFERFWRGWADLPNATRRKAGRALMKVDQQFLDKLAARLSGSIADRLKAVMIIRTLEQETYFEPHLIAQARDEQPRIASAAVRALARLGDSDAAVTTVREALEHDNDRVRSNAIEALQRMARVEQATGRLRELARIGGNRSRATAIRALLDHDRAAGLEALKLMLDDPDPRHRISGVWVAEQTMSLDVARQLADLAQDDSNGDVRRRALSLLRKIAEARAERAASSRSSNTIPES